MSAFMSDSAANPRLNFLFTTWEGGGAVTPAIVVAKKLIDRGHRVRVMSDSCNRGEAEAIGATFVSWKRAPNRPDRTPQSQPLKDWTAPTPQEGMMMVLREVWCGPALAYAQDVIEELKREPADLVVTCEALFGVMAGCESIGQDFVNLCPNISLAPIPGIPPMGPGFPPARNDEERAMHREVAKHGQGLFDAGLQPLNAARVALGLEPLEHTLDQFKAAKLELLCTSQAFDFPAESLPSRVRYVGPQLGDPAWAQSWKSPWLASDARPLVAVSFSTTFQGHTQVLQNVIDALASLPARVLVTLGGSVETRDLRPAANTIIVDGAPHSVVMQEASLVITHGGHGTVMRALSCRAPMLIIPHGRDQNDNAIRVSARGAGLTLLADATVDAIRTACTNLLNDPSFRAAAKRLGDAVAAEAENSTVVQELEEAATNSPIAAV
jgi:MGT family glycosyltransferase